MPSVLYLRAEEKALFHTLPSALTSAWEARIIDETIDGYESEQELTEKLSSLPFAEDPRYKAWARTHASFGAVGSPLLTDFPEDLLPSFFEHIGACGLSAIIELAFQSEHVNGTILEAVSALSTLRHQILTKNAVSA